MSRSFGAGVSALKVVVKFTTMEPVDQVFQAKEDHIGEREYLTSKKGTYICLITQISGDLWIGQTGNEAQVFIGKFKDLF